MNVQEKLPLEDKERTIEDDIIEKIDPTRSTRDSLYQNLKETHPEGDLLALTEMLELVDIMVRGIIKDCVALIKAAAHQELSNAALGARIDTLAEGLIKQGLVDKEAYEKEYSEKAEEIRTAVLGNLQEMSKTSTDSDK